jgi:hypothetical protein
MRSRILKDVQQWRNLSGGESLPRLLVDLRVEWMGRKVFRRE